MLLFANIVGFVLFGLSTFCVLYQETKTPLPVYLFISGTIILAIYLIKKGKHILASNTSLTALLIFDLFSMVQSMGTQHYIMNALPLILLMGFIFIGFITFKKWQILIYSATSLLFISIYYLSIISHNEQVENRLENLSIFFNYILFVIAGIIGMYLNFNFTSRLLQFEQKRTEQLNAYNKNLELLMILTIKIMSCKKKTKYSLSKRNEL